MDKDYNEVISLMKKHGGINAAFMDALADHREKKLADDMKRLRLRNQRKEENLVASGGTLEIGIDTIERYLNKYRFSLFDTDQFDFDHNGKEMLFPLKSGYIHAASQSRTFSFSHEEFIASTLKNFTGQLTFWAMGVYPIDEQPKGVLFEARSRIRYSDIKKLFRKHKNYVQLEGYRPLSDGTNIFGVRGKMTAHRRKDRKGENGVLEANNRWLIQRFLKCHQLITDFKLVSHPQRDISCVSV